MPGLRQLAQALAAGDTSARDLVEEALRRARQSQSVFTAINDGLPSLAASIDGKRAKAQSQAPLAGIPIVPAAPGPSASVQA